MSPALSRLTVCLPPALLAVVVYLGGVDVPYWDQWATAPLMDQLFGGELAFDQLWAPQAEHRIFVPRLVMIALAHLSGWNVRWELAVNVLLAAALWTAVTRGRLGADSGAQGFAVLASLLIFNLNQWENWTWGLQLVVLINASAVAAGLSLLGRDARSPRNLALGAVLGLVATFSFANGLLYWPLSLALVLVPEERRFERGAGWTLLASAAVAVYFSGYTMTTANGWRPDSLRDLVELVAFVAVFLGAPIFAFDGKLAGLGGVLGGVLFAVVVVCRLRVGRRAIAAATPWTALAGYAVGSGLLAAVGRLELGLAQAMSSRYILFSNFFWLALFGLLLLGAEAPESTLR